ncbi:MAG TPA: ATP-dependent helicase C-terminal domain-containing protein [Fibrobacteria bacterium]|nr:ATP-dependent helicase C-terminal domain-containing protein [Fibrobacteria bacterium]
MSGSAALPILAHRQEIADAVRRGGVLILCAPPGTGKSTQVPRFLLDRPGRIMVLQPRRIAARNLALRVAEEMGEAVGGTVGYQVRFEGRSREDTRILYQTYGVFFQQLLGDPLLEGIGTVLLDEFHERTLEADATLAWLKKLRAEARPDLALVVMSATLELEGLKAFLSPAPVVEVAAETFPVEISHQPPMTQEAPSQQAARAFKRLLAQGLSGSVLVFMPGQGEIRRTLEALEPLCRQHGLGLFELHGAMDMEAQQRALRAPLSGTCVIVSTNVAETSLTIPGVTVVIDSGQARIAAYSPQRDMNTLYLGSISLQSARQRAGRAGRTAPGRCVRLWSADRERAMPAVLEPEVLRVEPTSMALSLHSLADRYARLHPSGAGSGARNGMPIPWLTAPSPALWEKAEKSLEHIGALAPPSGALPASGTGRLTDIGRTLARFPAHPVLAKVLLDAKQAGVGPQAAAMAAVLESQTRRAKGAPADLFSLGLDLATDAEARRFDREIRESYKQLLRLLERAPVAAGGNAGGPQAGRGSAPKPTLRQEEDALRAAATRCWLLPFQDRIAVRVEKSQSFALADGRRGVVEAGQVPADVTVILALELHETGGANQNRQVGIPMLLPCEPAWVEAAFPGECIWTKVGGWDAARGRVMQEERLLFRGLALERKALKDGVLDPEESERLLVEKLASGEIELPNFDDEAKQMVQRIRLAAKAFPEYGLPKLDGDDWRLIYHEICEGRSSVRDLEGVSVTRALRDYLGVSLAAFVDRAAPTSLKLAGGRMGKLTYFENAPPELSARLGDFVGMEGKTAILEGKVEVVYDILAPNYRTVQKTADLSGFWKNTYPEVKKELKRRYPRHPWP